MGEREGGRGGEGGGSGEDETERELVLQTLEHYILRRESRRTYFGANEKCFQVC